MPDHVSVDTRELRQLAIDLSGAPNRLQRRAPRTLRREVNGLRVAMQRAAEGHRYLRTSFANIGSSRTDAFGLAYEVGFNKVEQAKLANIIVFGSVNNAPVYPFHAPLIERAPRIANALGGDAEDCVLGGAE